MLTYHLGALSGSPAYSATSLNGRSMMVSVRTSTPMVRPIARYRVVLRAGKSYTDRSAFGTLGLLGSEDTLNQRAERQLDPAVVSSSIIQRCRCERRRIDLPTRDESSIARPWIPLVRIANDRTI